MDSSRKSKAQPYASERIVGEDQWLEGKGTTLGEYLGSWVVWLALGVCLGFLMRAGVLPWIESAGAEMRWMEAAYVAAALAATVLAVLVWVWLGSRLTRLRRRHAGSALAWGMPLVLSLCAVMAVWGWPSSGEEAEVNLELGGRFAFGTSPTRSQMSRLKREGFVGIVSLLHPSGPERAEIWRQESQWAQELGLMMVLAPLEPEHGLGMGTFEALSGVVESGEGPWFVESGGDSIRLALGRRLLTRITGSEAAVQALPASGSYERGPVLELAVDVVLTPFPTEDELLREYLGGSVRDVLSLLDPADSADRVWLDQETEILSRFGIGVYTSPVPEEPFDPLAALAAVEAARALRRPLVVQTFLTPSVASEAFRIAWSTGLPPLPPQLFDEPLDGGAARVVAANLAVGPRPTGREFRTLHNRGVRRIARVERGGPAPVGPDRELSRVAGLEWQEHPGDEDAFLDLLAEGGPWYIYGSGAEELTGRLATRPSSAPNGESDIRSDTLASRSGASWSQPALARGRRTFGSEHGS